ncbi:MAG TPA: FAD-dependent oxidoreductase [Acidimicrobiales bacterium]|nr:FAD-dependent oxidoreductase [Acidimicrobiales bacterium]
MIGAGMAGLTAAHRLAEAGMRVTVVDKGRGVGGRMATRRLGGATLDHGAQFFTARSDWFQGQVDGWVDAGAAHEWCRGFRRPPDGHPRYAGTGGMTTVAKHLASGLPDVRTATLVQAVTSSGQGWRLALDGGDAIDCRAVLLTAPVPQGLALCADAPLAGVAKAALEQVAYSPTFALLVVTDGPASVPPPGGVQIADGPISWVGDNVAKGASAAPAVTLHLSAAESAARYDDSTDDVRTFMLDAGRRYLGDGQVLEAQVMRWRYAQPVTSHDERYLVAAEAPGPLVFAGDAFAEAKVEGAARSGLEAAGALLDRLTA